MLTGVKHLRAWDRHRLERDVVAQFQHRIRQCACGEWFYQWHKQRYCTPTCSQRVRTARWLARNRRGEEVV